MNTENLNKDQEILIFIVKEMAGAKLVQAKSMNKNKRRNGSFFQKEEISLLYWAVIPFVIRIRQKMFVPIY